MTSFFRYITINSFSCVDIQERSLILCDIDDTLLYTKDDIAKSADKMMMLYHQFILDGVPEMAAIRMAE
jgi:hypothetical protein